MNNVRFRALLLGVVFTCWLRPALAQTTNATLSGVVRDAQGAAVPQASVAVVQVATGQTRQTATGDTGNYTIPELAIGEYKVTASAAGFKTTVVPSVTLQVNQAAELNLTLEVGVVSDQITITSTMPLLATESSSVGTVVENRAIESLALNGRQFWQLVALVPGASYTPGGDRTRTGGSSIRSSAVNVQINGTGFIYN
ncbi:MAG: Cna domain protein, partial [Bryobacterales bacterium]|nr:Cna domain protein [Bryobacterales bacterium]